MFRTSIYPSSGVRVVYCCMWCSAHAAVHNLNSWRWTYRRPKHVELFMIITHNCCIKLVPLVEFNIVILIRWRLFIKCGVINEWNDEYANCHHHELKKNILSAQTQIPPLTKTENKGIKNTLHNVIAVTSNIKKIPRNVSCRKLTCISSN